MAFWICSSEKEERSSCLTSSRLGGYLAGRRNRARISSSSGELTLRVRVDLSCDCAACSSKIPISSMAVSAVESAVSGNVAR